MLRAITLLAVLGAVGGAVYWLSRASTAPTAPAPAAPAPSPSPAASPAPLPAVGVPAPTRTAPKARDRRHELELPDGTYVPALNGAIDPEPLASYWGNWPWSPIVGVERSSAGVDWYRHEDGSYSTTEMVRADPGNRTVVMTRVAHPSATTAPTAPATGR